MQRYLYLKSWWATNYVTDWWELYVYLYGRSSIMINSNYYTCVSAEVPCSHMIQHCDHMTPNLCSVTPLFPSLSFSLPLSPSPPTPPPWPPLFFLSTQETIQAAPLTNLPAARVGMISNLMMRMKRDIETERLKPLIIMGLIPLCSVQYDRLFGTTRVPGQETGMHRGGG